MGRYTGASCKLCRREGMKLFLKGDRCYMAKCAIDQGRPAPGMHQQRRSKMSDYGVQLREKQRLRRMYGLQEGQFRNMYEKAARSVGITGQILLQLLECRLDNLVYRAGFAPSRKSARQFVRHGHITVNGKKASIPSMTLKAGDTFGVSAREASRAYAAIYVEVGEGRGFPAWLQVDKANLKAVVSHVPSRDEIAPIVDEQLIVELYSK